MELKKLAEQTARIFGTTQISELGEALYKSVIENDFETLDAFKTLVKDLSVDWLQKIYQYHYADRENLGQDYTPKSLAKLTAVLSANAVENKVLDMCAGSGALTIQKWNTNHRLEFICIEFDNTVIPFLLFNLAVRNITATVIQGDALTGEVFRAWNVAGNKNNDAPDYSIVNEIPTSEAESIEADTAISNPPYNLQWEYPEGKDKSYLFGQIPPNNNANFAFVLSAFQKVKTRAVYILPQNVLNSTNREEAAIRKWLVEKNYIEAVISCPDKMFESTNIATCILVLNKAKYDNFVEFIRMNDTYAEEKREQRGQYGGKSHTSRVYQKTIKAFTDEHIKFVRQSMIRHTSEPERANAVTTDEILRRDGILSPSRYVGLTEQEIKHRPYADIISDINRLTREQSVLKLTVNEKLAKELGLDIDLYKNQKEQAAGLNKSFEVVGGKYEWRPYITFSKNKNELKFENQDKEILSSIFSIFFPIWKQHIYYLNNEINRHLAELRDAMLPELMSGELDVSGGGGGNGDTNTR